MLNYLLRLVISAVAVVVASRTLQGIHVDSYQTAFIVAFVLSILNTFVKPILQFLSIPITILTLGLFYFVINVGIIYLAASLVNGFSVEGFLPPLLLTLFLSVANGIASMFQD